jgi:hypothetical protein
MAKPRQKKVPVNQDDHRPKSPGKSEKPGQSKKGSREGAASASIAKESQADRDGRGPWLFGLSAGAQTTIGLFIAVLAAVALAAFAVWEEWLSLIAGLWLIGLPWLLGFEDSDTITICVVTGTIVAALAAFKVWLVHHRDQRITLSH